EDVYPEMKGLEWGRLYETYHDQSYNPAEVKAAVEKLMADEYVTNRKGIFEYVLGREKEKKLLAVRVFDERTKKVAYTKQTQAARGKNQSNCPLCAVGDNANKARIYKLDEMDADHVAAWSKGGDSSAENCEMLCKTHNQAKGNR
ncbi:MAG: HNH endonuclease, partial [Phycisphaerales bacterium]|nr:HNH endonuclease [Phycisphaerales bacterium]